MLEFDPVYIFFALDELNENIEEDGLGEDFIDVVGRIRDILEDEEVDLTNITDDVIEDLVHDYGDPILIAEMDGFNDENDYEIQPPAEAA